MSNAPDTSDDIMLTRVVLIMPKEDWNALKARLGANVRVTSVENETMKLPGHVMSLIRTTYNARRMAALSTSGHNDDDDHNPMTYIPIVRVVRDSMREKGWLLRDSVNAVSKVVYDLNQQTLAEWDDTTLLYVDDFARHYEALMRHNAVNADASN